MIRPTVPPADLARTLRHDSREAVRFVGNFMMRTDPVHETMFRAAKRLDELGVAYALCGGMAMTFHGYVRATVDVDFLVTADGLKAIHENLDGRGYVPPFAGSRQLRDTVTGVRVKFLVAGGFPGDGRPKPVAFPDSAQVGIATEKDGVKVLTVESLIELKLASGMTAGHRLKDLADVQQMIEALGLTDDFAERLDPYVREKFVELSRALRETRPDWEESGND